MRRLFFIGAILALPLAAQEVQQRVQGYTYMGLMGSNEINFGQMLNPGIGADVFVYKGLAANVDVGYTGYYNNFANEGFGIFSPNVSYHFRKSARFDPFVTAGYSMAFRSWTYNMGNYGGGFTCWFAKHAGFRFEARDHRDGSENFFTALRFGISFR